MNKEDKILSVLRKMQGDMGKMQDNITKLQETQDRTILAVVNLQHDMREVKEKLIELPTKLVTREEYLAGQDLILKKLSTLETKKVFTDSRLQRIEARIER